MGPFGRLLGPGKGILDRSCKEAGGPRRVREGLLGSEGDFGEDFWVQGELGELFGFRGRFGSPGRRSNVGSPNVGPSPPSPQLGGPKSGPGWPHHPPLPLPFPGLPRGRGAPLTWRELEATAARIGVGGVLTWGGVARLAPMPNPGL